MRQQYRWWVVGMLVGLFAVHGVGRSAAPQAAGADIDSEAELVVALSDDTNAWPGAGLETRG